MDQGLRWAAALALALLLLGMLALAINDPYEGPVVLMLDSQHALRALDLIGAVLIAGAMVLVWAVGLTWQHRNVSPSYYRHRVMDDEWGIGHVR